MTERPPGATVHPACGKWWTGANREHCPVCCETFSGSSVGDAHRAGAWPGSTRYERPVHQGGGPRRCLTREQMAAKGWRLDAKGIWHLPGTWSGPEKPGAV